jgi:hypothetical protein
MLHRVVVSTKSLRGKGAWCGSPIRFFCIVGVWDIISSLAIGSLGKGRDNKNK